MITGPCEGWRGTAGSGFSGHAGGAIGRREAVNGSRQEIIIDPATGQVIGERQHCKVTSDGAVTCQAAKK